MGGGAELLIPWAEWEMCVFSFADSISAFYASCAAKRIADTHDYAGWMKFKQEWARRRGHPPQLTLEKCNRVGIAVTTMSASLVSGTRIESLKRGASCAVGLAES